MVSNLGEVKSLRRTVIDSIGRCHDVKEKILSKRLNDRGYIEIKLSIYGKGYYKKLHRLVAQAFIDNPHNKPEVNHMDTNKTNNRVDNLEWATHSENQKHAHENGLYSRKGSSNSCNKIIEDDVVQIKKMIKSKIKGRYIAKKFNISPSTVSAIKNNRLWTHVKI